MGDTRILNRISNLLSPVVVMRQGEAGARNIPGVLFILATAFLKSSSGHLNTELPLRSLMPRPECKQAE